MLWKIISAILFLTVIGVKGNCNIPNNQEWIKGELFFTTDDNATYYEQRWRTENITGVELLSYFEYATARIDPLKNLLIFGVLPALKKRYIVYENKLTKSVNISFDCSDGTKVVKLFTLNVHQVTKSPPGFQIDLYHFNLGMPMYPNETFIFPTPIAHDLSINEYLTFYFTTGECNKFFRFIIMEVRKKEFFTQLQATKYVYLKDINMLCNLAVEDMDGIISGTQINITVRDKTPWERRLYKPLRLK